MDDKTNSAAMDVALFCRLNTHHKPSIPIRYSEMGTLIFIFNAEQPVRAVEISNFFGISRPSAAAMVKKLMKDGYIGREPSKQDGRSYTLFITHSGRQLVELAYAEYTKTVETMRREMGDENFSQLLTLIQQANTVLKNK